MTICSAGLLLFGRTEADIFDQARTKVVEAAAPLMEFLSLPVTAVRERAGNFQDYLDVYEQNRRLKEENSRLLAWKSTAFRLEQMVARYEALLNVQPEPGTGYITGRVVADGESPFVHTLIVNAGTDDGARKGQAVIDTNGLIGRVVVAGSNASRILLINDLNSRIPVFVGPGQYRAVMAGNNTHEPLLLYLPETAQVRTGQRVVTSGHGGMLPPDLPVGEVLEGPGGELLVRPFTKQGQINFVRLLQFDFPQEITPAMKSIEAQIPTSTEKEENES